MILISGRPFIIKLAPSQNNPELTECIQNRLPLGWQVLELAQPDYNTTKGSRYMHQAFSIVNIIEPEAGPPFTRYNSSLHNAML